MAISNITNSYVNNTTTSANTKKTSEKKTDTTKTTTTPTEDAVVYEKETEETTDASKKIYQPNTDVINQLKADAERRTSQLRQLVEKMLLKQGTTFTETMDMFQLIKNGQLEVDPETAKQAQEDISEDGYWGVEQTSDRLMSFAIALSGGDTSKADTLMDAIKKGYEEATEAWGDELPDICKQTLEAVETKMEAWKNGTYTASSTETTTENIE